MSRYVFDPPYNQKYGIKHIPDPKNNSSNLNLDVQHTLTIENDVAIPIKFTVSDLSGFTTKIWLYTEEQYNSWLESENTIDFGTLVYDSINETGGTLNSSSGMRILDSIVIPADNLIEDSYYAVKMGRVSGCEPKTPDRSIFNGHTYNAELHDMIGNYYDACPVVIGLDDLSLISYSNKLIPIYDSYIHMTTDESGNLIFTPYTILHGVLVSTVSVNGVTASDMIKLSDICNYCADMPVESPIEAL